MIRRDLLLDKIEEALQFLYEQDTKLKPLIEKLEELLMKKIKEEELTSSQVFEMYIKIQEQYTNSVLLMTKIKELLEFKV